MPGAPAANQPINHFVMDRTKARHFRLLFLSLRKVNFVVCVPAKGQAMIMLATGRIRHFNTDTGGMHREMRICPNKRSVLVGC